MQAVRSTFSEAGSLSGFIEINREVAPTCGGPSVKVLRPSVEHCHAASWHWNELLNLPVLNANVSSFTQW